MLRKSVKTGNAYEGYPLKCQFQVGIPSKISLLKELSSKAYSGIKQISNRIEPAEFSTFFYDS